MVLCKGQRYLWNTMMNTQHHVAEVTIIGMVSR